MPEGYCGMKEGICTYSLQLCYSKTQCIALPYSNSTGLGCVVSLNVDRLYTREKKGEIAWARTDWRTVQTQQNSLPLFVVILPFLQSSFWATFLRFFLVPLQQIVSVSVLSTGCLVLFVGFFLPSPLDPGVWSPEGKGLWWYILGLCRAPVSIPSSDWRLTFKSLSISRRK